MAIPFPGPHFVDFFLQWLSPLCHLSSLLSESYSGAENIRNISAPPYPNLITVSICLVFLVSYLCCHMSLSIDYEQPRPHSAHQPSHHWLSPISSLDSVLYGFNTAFSKTPKNSILGLRPFSSIYVPILAALFTFLLFRGRSRATEKCLQQDRCIIGHFSSAFDVLWFYPDYLVYLFFFQGK